MLSRFLLAAITVGALQLPLAAVAKPLWDFQVGGWKGSARATDDGAFSHCTTVMAYEDQFKVALTIRGDYQMQMVIANPDWTLPEQPYYKVTLRINERDAGVFPAFLVQGRALQILLGTSVDLYKRLSSAVFVSMPTRNGDLRFELSDADVVMAALRDCVDEGNGPGSQTANPYTTQRLHSDASPPKSGESGGIEPEADAEGDDALAQP